MTAFSFPVSGCERDKEIKESWSSLLLSVCLLENQFSFNFAESGLNDEGEGVVQN